MSESDLRIDPLTGAYVLVTPWRQHRPNLPRGGCPLPRRAGERRLQPRRHPARPAHRRRSRHRRPRPYGSVGADINCTVIGFTGQAPTANLATPVPNSQFPHANYEHHPERPTLTGARPPRLRQAWPSTGVACQARPTAIGSAEPPADQSTTVPATNAYCDRPQLARPADRLRARRSGRCWLDPAETLAHAAPTPRARQRCERTSDAFSCTQEIGPGAAGPR